MCRILALDIGGTAIKAALFGGENELLWRTEVPSNGKAGGERLIQAACDVIGACPGAFAAIGVSTTGQVDAKSGRIVFANENVPGYTGMDVRGLLQARFSVPVEVENDVNAAALGEAYFGAGRGAQDFLCLTYGTGVGGAIVQGGHVYGGSKGVAGEMGHMLTHPGGLPCACGQRGCYEQYASASALVKSAVRVDPLCWDGRAVFARMESDARIRRVVDNWIFEVLTGLVSLTHIFNPSLFVLGGGVMGQPYVIEQLRARFAGLVMPSFAQVRLECAQLRNQAGVYGAMALARERIGETL